MEKKIEKEVKEILKYYVISYENKERKEQYVFEKIHEYWVNLDAKGRDDLSKVLSQYCTAEMIKTYMDRLTYFELIDRPLRAKLSATEKKVEYLEVKNKILTLKNKLLQKELVWTVKVKNNMKSILRKLELQEDNVNE